MAHLLRDTTSQCGKPASPIRLPQSSEHQGLPAHPARQPELVDCRPSSSYFSGVLSGRFSNAMAARRGFACGRPSATQSLSRQTDTFNGAQTRSIWTAGHMANGRRCLLTWPGQLAFCPTSILAISYDGQGCYAPDKAASVGINAEKGRQTRVAEGTRTPDTQIHSLVL